MKHPAARAVIATVALSCALCLSGLSACSISVTATTGPSTSSDTSPSTGSDTGSDSGSDEAQAGDSVTTQAMVYVQDDGSILFIDSEDDSPYYPTNLEKAEIVGTDGNPIESSQLATGNIVNVTGDGIVLESYPGLYPEIDRVEVVDEGTPEDADRYADVLEMLS